MKFGKPFLDLFEECGRDFYKIDPMLFSPAVVQLISLRSGNTYEFGEYRPDLIQRSFLENP